MVAAGAAQPVSHGFAAAIAVDNRDCSCKLTRVQASSGPSVVVSTSGDEMSVWDLSVGEMRQVRIARLAVCVLPREAQRCIRFYVCIVPTLRHERCV